MYVKKNELTCKDAEKMVASFNLVTPVTARNFIESQLFKVA